MSFLQSWNGAYRPLGYSAVSTHWIHPMALFSSFIFFSFFFPGSPVHACLVFRRMVKTSRPAEGCCVCLCMYLVWWGGEYPGWGQKLWAVNSCWGSREESFFSQHVATRRIPVLQWMDPHLSTYGPHYLNKAR